MATLLASTDLRCEWWLKLVLTVVMKLGSCVPKVLCRWLRLVTCRLQLGIPVVRVLCTCVSIRLRLKVGALMDRSRVPTEGPARTVCVTTC